MNQKEFSLHETLNQLEDLIEKKGLISLQSPCPSTTEMQLNSNLYDACFYLRMAVKLADDLGYKNL